MTRIISLELQGVKKVKAAHFNFNRNLNVITGKNKAGKTGILDAIMYAVGGDKYKPSSLRNDDLEEGENPFIGVKLSNGMTVERKGKNSSLKISSEDKAKYKQGDLNSFITEFALDIGKFINASDAEKRKIIIEALGDAEALEVLEKKEKELEADRAFENKNVKKLEGAYALLPIYADKPKELISLDDLNKEYKDAVDTNNDFQKEREAIDDDKNDLVDMEKKLNSLEFDILEDEKALENLKKSIASKKESVERGAKAIATKKEEIQGREFTSDLSIDIDTEEITEKIKNIGKENEEINANIEKERVRVELRKAEKEAKRLDNEVIAIRKKKNAIIKTDKANLPGLSFESDELLYEGKAWDCMSGSQQYIVATSISRVISPDCNFILADKLDALDSSSLKEYDEWLTKEDLQAITTSVHAGDSAHFVIEDGEVKS